MVRINQTTTKRRLTTLAVVGSLFSTVTAQTYRKTAACPGLGCLFPPVRTFSLLPSSRLVVVLTSLFVTCVQDQVDFIPGSVFDIRVEVQAPLNGSRPYNNGEPNPDFSLTIGRKKDGSDAKPVSEYYKIEEPVVESYNFTYFEDLFYKDNGTATFVNVLARDWRHVSFQHHFAAHDVSRSGLIFLWIRTGRPLRPGRVLRHSQIQWRDGDEGSMDCVTRA